MVVERDDRTRRPIRDPQWEFLWGAPNRSTPGAPWWTELWAHLIGWSNAFVFRRRLDGVTVGLDLLHPACVTVDRHESGEPSYVFRPRGGAAEQRYGRDEVCHIIMGLSDGLRGIPPVAAGAAIHRISRLQDRWMMQHYRRVAPSGIISLGQQKLDDLELEEIGDRLEEQHGAAGSPGGIMIMQGDATFMPVVPPSDEHLLAARQFTREEILGLYCPGAPHHLLGWRANASNFGTGIENQNRAMLVHVFEPRLKLVADVISWSMLPPDLTLAWDTEMWVQGDAKTTADVLARLRQAGLITREEGRAQLRRPRLDVPDEVWRPANMDAVPVDGAGRGSVAGDD